MTDLDLCRLFNVCKRYWENDERYKTCLTCGDLAGGYGWCSKPNCFRENTEERPEYCLCCGRILEER